MWIPIGLNCIKRRCAAFTRIMCFSSVIPDMVNDTPSASEFYFVNPLMLHHEFFSKFFCHKTGALLFSTLVCDGAWSLSTFQKWNAHLVWWVFHFLLVLCRHQQKSRYMYQHLPVSINATPETTFSWSIHLNRCLRCFSAMPHYAS